MTIISQRKIQNILLRSLSPESFAQVSGDFKARNFPLRTSLLSPGESIEVVTYPETCVVSVVATTAEGRQAEVGLVGVEGLVGIAAVFGENHSPIDCFTQVPGDALQLPVRSFTAVMESNADFRAVHLRYAHSFLIQVSHSALAYSAYNVVERLARWLLMTHDRSRTDDIVITHEFLSLMLGVRRAGVTTALQSIVRLGYISTHRGRVGILDRTGLEELAGDSYGTPEAAYRRAFTLSPGDATN